MSPDGPVGGQMSPDGPVGGQMSPDGPVGDQLSPDVWVSVLLLAGIVLLCSATRRLISASELLRDSGLHVYAVELVSTFQLCACTHELKLLAEVGGVDTRLALTFTYASSVVHALTAAGAVGNPCAALERACRGRMTRACALWRVACQFTAACLARAAAPAAWSLGMSEVHARHARLHGLRCLQSPVRASLPRAAAVELACAFAVQTAATHTHALEEKYRVHAIATVVTTLVYAGGGVTGAVFNPALAFSTQFPCSGNSFLEYSLVYWLAPLLGMLSSVLLFDRVLPLLSGKTPPPPYRPLESKKRN